MIHQTLGERDGVHRVGAGGVAARVAGERGGDAGDGWEFSLSARKVTVSDVRLSVSGVRTPVSGGESRMSGGEMWMSVASSRVSK
jgi:hypothetical protein